MKQPLVSVGIIQHAPHIDFTLHGIFRTETGRPVSGTHRVTLAESPLTLTPADDKACFTLHSVTIGKAFHWQQQEDQTFTGSLTILPDGDGLTAVNRLPAEDYLTSVISSEMKATSAPEFLKAHAVIARSWLLAQMEKRHHAEAQPQPTSDTLIRWYDREDHELFDVCADDHCQRYQGITKVTNPAVEEAVRATRGQVLTADGKLCDARFSKCCGGISETFSTCWDEHEYSYLQPVRDLADPDAPLPDLSREEEAERWIRTAPDAFCHTRDKHLLAQVLNTYDLPTTDFYRWTVHYTQSELAALVRERSGLDFGDILDLVPVKRGASGRLSLLRIVGTRRTLTVGKELEIRRWLSPTHLYSSAFVVDKEAGTPPAGFTLTGAGWGHGVGLCQIGAAVMGQQGYAYDAILLHYYRNAQLTTLYT